MIYMRVVGMECVHFQSYMKSVQIKYQEITFRTFVFNPTKNKNTS